MEIEKYTETEFGETRWVAELTGLQSESCSLLREQRRHILSEGATMVGVTETPTEQSATVHAPTEQRCETALEAAVAVINEQ